jgi:glycosyltransferase involved in cell wall biosynthesis
MVRRLRGEFPFDVILAAWAYPDAVAGAMLARDFECPLVTMTLGSDINEIARNPRLRPQIQWALSRSYRVVAVSAALRDGVVGLGVPAERVLVQHNGVDGDSFVIQDRQQVRVRLGLEGDRKYVCFVGNLKVEKGVDVLIDAMDRLVNARKRDVDLVIVGSGAEEERLRSAVEAMCLKHRVRFAGRRPHPEIKDWIAACDVFCLPSRREGCPNVVLEALSCGRPVVASDVGGVPELLSASNGLVVPPDDADALTAALDIAISRKWDAEQLRGSVGALSWDQFGHTLRDVLTSAITQAPLGVN